jgi:hypothetical protein
MTKARTNAYGTTTLGSSTLTLGSATTSVSGLELVAPKELTTVTTAVPTATTNYDLLTQGVYISTGTTTANVTLNFRGNSSATLASSLNVNDAWTGSFMMTNGATSAYYISAVQVDGSTSTVTMKWSGGTAPAAGNLSASDAYSFTIVKTSSSPTYTVYGAGPVKYS